MAQKTVVRSSQCVDIPDDVDDIPLAAIADPGMSAWVALESCAKLVKGETVLVNGATGSAGTMAVQITKHLGAKKVIATGRNQQSLNTLLSIGADEVLRSKTPATHQKPLSEGTSSRVLTSYLIISGVLAPSEVRQYFRIA